MVLPIMSYLFEEGVKHVLHSPENKETLNKCYVEVQAMGYVSGTSTVEMVMEGGRKSIAGRGKSMSRSQRHVSTWHVSQSLRFGFFFSHVLWHSSHSTVINMYLLSDNYESGTVLGAEDKSRK